MITNIISFILHLDSHLAALVASYGLWVYGFLFLIVFLETGLVVTPFLPGDSLLFVAGAMAAVGDFNIWILFFILSLAAILGDTVNYAMGKYFGENVFSKFIKKEHLAKTQNFFDKYGKKTIILARFVPIVRTFAPFVAGVGKMHYLTFLSFNIIGALVWVSLFTLSGFFFGNLPIVKENLGFIILGIILVSLLPILFEYLKHKKTNK
ncbi:DedA family protein [Patescibacteria group bacterium]|jgi:membrane-associated protein|nr:DedA family protein [Patescibacteria group bacterium]